MEGEFDVNEAALATKLLSSGLHFVVLLLGVVHLHEEKELLTFLGDASFDEVEGFDRGRAVKHDEANVLRRINFAWICDDIKHSDESFPDHKVGDEVVG